MNDVGDRPLAGASVSGAAMKAEGFAFSVEARDGAARAGCLVTPHGVVETPCFMPVGTRATVKTLSPRDLTEVGAGIILAVELRQRPCRPGVRPHRLHFGPGR